MGHRSYDRSDAVEEVPVLICISTFMIKQHSVLDMIGALPFALIGWAMTYRYAGCEDLVRQNS